MAFTYPITLNLHNQKCLVVGGGQVAERKILTLLAEEALVTVVSPTLTEILAQRAQQGLLTWVEGLYDARFLTDCFLVIAATSDHQVNGQIAQDCAQSNKLVNVIDDKEVSNFTVSSYFTQGDLLIAVSTNGISPALAKAIRLALAEQFGVEYAQALTIVGEARNQAKVSIQDEKKRRLFLQELAKMNLIEMLQEQTIDDVKKRVKLCLSSYWD